MRLLSILSAGAVLLCAISSHALAAATLRYPLVYEKTLVNKHGTKSYRSVLVSTLNPKLKEKGIESFPDSIELLNGDQADKLIGEYDKKFGNAATVLSLPHSRYLIRYSMSGVTGNGLKKDKSLCYTGDPKDAVALIESLTSLAFSEQQGTIAYRYKQTKVFSENVSEADYEESLPAIWDEWRGRGEAILYLWHETDDGDDVNDAIIYRCK